MSVGDEDFLSADLDILNVGVFCAEVAVAADGDYFFVGELLGERVDLGFAVAAVDDHLGVFLGVDRSEH